MTTATAPPSAPSSDHDEVDHGHPADSTYWKVAGFLVVLTALEVSTYFWPHSWHKGAAVALIIMMTIKFGTVAAYFMHLKNDAVILRRLFITGLVLAAVVYAITLSMFTFWQDSGVSGVQRPAAVQAAPAAADRGPRLDPGRRALIATGITS